MDYRYNSRFNLNKENRLTMLLICAKGLEHLVVEEIRSLFKEVNILQINRGKIIIEITFSLNKLLKLKCVDNIYLYIDKLYCGKTKSDLDRFCDELRNIRVVDLSKIYNLKDSKSAIWVNASREGNHNYSKNDIEIAAMNALLTKKDFVNGKENKHDLEFRVDCVNNEAIISVRLTSAQFRFRSNQRDFSAGAIRPTIAHSMIWLSDPQKNDVFYDPCCGSGTILAERQEYPAMKIIGTDISMQVIEVARNNVSTNVVLFQGDATKMKMKDGSISKIVSNIPWDVQIKLEDVYEFYYNFIGEVKRVLKPEGKAVLLTDKRELLLEVCSKQSIACTEVATLSLHGLHPGIFEIQLKK